MQIFWDFLSFLAIGVVFWISAGVYFCEDGDQDDGRSQERQKKRKEVNRQGGGRQEEEESQRSRKSEEVGK